MLSMCNELNDRPMAGVHINGNDCESLDKYPRLTPRDEERGWMNTSQDEMAEIEADLRGQHIDTEAYERRANAAAEASYLSALETEIRSLPQEEKSVLLEARRKCPELVDAAHIMAFLWREGFDAKLAARRIASCWQYKLRLFGPEKCYLPLTLCGALRDDLISLSKGLVQLLPQRDQYGRAVIFVVPSRYDKRTDNRDSMIRAFWYLCHVASENPAVRDRGIVLLSFPKNVQFRHADPEMVRCVSELETRYLPIRIRSVQICHPPVLFHIIHPVFKLVLSARMRKRVKVHFGTDDDVLWSLDKFGLTRDRVPSDLGGEIKLDPVRWLSDRMVLEGLGGWARLTPPPTTESFADVPMPFNRQQGSLNYPQANYGIVHQVVRLDPSGSGVTDNVSGEAAPQSWLQPSLDASGIECGLIQSNQAEKAMAARRFTDRQDKQNMPLNEITEHQVIKPSGSSQYYSANAAQPCNIRSSAEPSSSDKAPAQSEPTKSTARKRARSSSGGKRGDPRMNRAVSVRLANPQMSLCDALLAGGFVFPTLVAGQKELSDQQTKDSDNVSLYQRKNQLNRRLREARKGDQRMTRAVAAKVENPQLTLAESLIQSGYEFSLTGLCDRLIRDVDKVSLYSRKIELCKRLAELPRHQMGHIMACSNEEDLCYMNPSKKSHVPPGDGNRSLAKSPSDAGDGCSESYSDRSHVEAEQPASPPSDPQMNAANTKMTRSNSANSFVDSILEIPGIDDESVDELVVGAWLWNPDDHSLPHANQIQPHTGVSFC